MAYTILRSDGSILVELADGRVDDTTTSLTLVGRNKGSYGEALNNNLIKLLSNFANTSINPPKNPIIGQIWYDRTAKRLKVYDGEFRILSGAILSGTRPTTANIGDLWFDTVNNQLKILNQNSELLIGPSFSSTVGENGWTLPVTLIKDDNATSRNLTLLKNFGKTIGVISSDAFNVYSPDSATYFGTSTFSMVAGVNVLGDISYTGKIDQRYITITLPINSFAPSNPAIDDSNEFLIQTNNIITILNATYPINTTTNLLISNPVNISSPENGVSYNSEARVIVTGGLLLGGTLFNGIQIRRFIAKTNTWDYYDITGGVFNTLTNVIATIQGT